MMTLECTVAITCLYHCDC